MEKVKKIKRGIGKTYKEVVGLFLITFLSIVCTLLMHSIYDKMSNLEIINFLSNPLKIIYIYMILLSFFIALSTLYKENIFKEDKINMLKSIEKIQFVSIFLIPTYLFSIVNKKETIFLFTFFALIFICFYLFMTIIYLSYYSLKEKVDDIEIGG